MKEYELMLEYVNGEVECYYSNLTGHGWKTRKNNLDDVIEEMMDKDIDTFLSIGQCETIEYMWVEEIA